jgi:hypothetical protein
MNLPKDIGSETRGGDGEAEGIAIEMEVGT